MFKKVETIKRLGIIVASVILSACSNAQTGAINNMETVNQPRTTLEEISTLSVKNAIQTGKVVSPGYMNAEQEETKEMVIVRNLKASTISVSSIKVEWNGNDKYDYEIECTTESPEGKIFEDNIRFKKVSSSKCYITGLREGTEYNITVKPVSKSDNVECIASNTTCSTESVNVIRDFPQEPGWTNCFAFENANGLTQSPSWDAIQNCYVDEVTDTGIMRTEYGDYCVAMGTVYGYCGDRFLIELNNGVQFTVKICDSKGDRRYHPYAERGKCIIEFIHADGCVPPEVSYTGNYGDFSWDGLIFDNIRSIKQIEYGNKIEY